MLRFCVNYQKLNKVTRIEAYPLPEIDKVTKALGGNEWFSTLDLYSRYWQIPVEKDSIEKTAFMSQDGIYEFLVLPFGLTIAPATF